MLNMFTYIKFVFSALLAFAVFATCLTHAGAEEKKKNHNLNKGVFLIASDKIRYGALGKTVIYVTQHDEAGTSGFIINRPTNLLVNQAFPETQASETTNTMLYFGGPLHSQYLFMLTQTQFTHGLHQIQKDVYFGASDDVKMRLRSNNKRDKIRTYAGFMSWGPDQLDNEISAGDWVIAPASVEQLFLEDTSNLWKELYRRWGGSWI